MLTTVVLVHTAATLFMAGLIWFVQVVHYPLFAAVGEAGFTSYQGAHVRRTTWVVFPPMMLELGTAGLLVWATPPGVPAAAAWLGFALVGAIWLSTAALQVPAHRTLESRFDAAAQARLVSTNWLRTALWSARAVLALWIMHRAAAPAVVAA